MKLHRLLAALLLAGLTAQAQSELRVPGFTAYLDPEDGNASVSSRAGVTDWNDPAQKVLWVGEIKTPGKLDCAVALHLPPGVESKLRLTVAGKSSEATAQGAGDKAVNVSFGSFDIAAAGYQKFTLESLNASGKPAGDIAALILSGPAANAHFNLKPGRGRAASSVHLNYQVPDGVKVEAFYCEVTGLEDRRLALTSRPAAGIAAILACRSTARPSGGSFSACGTAATRPWTAARSNDADRVTLVAKGEGVNAGDFGNEGTGGHSHLVYDWKTGERNSGFWSPPKWWTPRIPFIPATGFIPNRKNGCLISSWKAPKDGGYLHGLYSFVEDFGGDNGQLHRKALYGNQWIRTADGQWHEQTTATFSHDPTGKADRLDRFMGVENGQFFLSTGGFIPGFTKFGELFTRPAIGHPPTDFDCAAVFPRINL